MITGHFLGKNQFQNTGGRKSSQLRRREVGKRTGKVDHSLECYDKEGERRIRDLGNSWKTWS